jgi:hypothetical protein
MTTASEEKQREEAVPLDSSPETLRGEGRTCATSVALPVAAALTAVTERVRKAGQVMAAAAAVLDKPGSLVHSQPPTFRQAQDRHHECARHYGHSAIRWSRLLLGYFHLLVIMPALYLAVWVTESPARFLVAAALTAAVWFFA